MHVLTQASETLTFPGLQAEPVPSILRGFSAPVILDFDYSDEQLLTLLAHDTDPFNRWEAGQRLAVSRAIALHHGRRARRATSGWTTPTSTRCAAILRHPTLDAAFKELVLTLPAETYLAEQLDVVDPQRIHAVREAMREQLAQALYDDWQWACEAHRETGAYQPDAGLLGPPRAGGPGAHAPVPGRAAQRRHGVAGQGAAALQGRGQHDRPLQRAGRAGDQPATSWRRRRLQSFHAIFKNEPLVLDKWFCAAGRRAGPRRQHPAASSSS